MTSNLEDIQRAKLFISSLPRDMVSKAAIEFDKLEYGDEILPFELYRNTRGNIVRVADEINASYYYGIYDGCFVLMRRLIEMLLILAYKEHKIESEIRGAEGNYLQLSHIIDKAIISPVLDLTRNTKDYLDIFRENGGLAAHNPFFTAVPKDIELLQPKFRAIIQELFFKAGIMR